MIEGAGPNPRIGKITHQPREGPHMGEAKRKKAALAALQAKPDAATLELLEKALSRVIGATTSAHGADCLLYAGVGAKLLQALGYPARMVIGSAAWRVGPGSGDVIAHALEITSPDTPIYAPHVLESMVDSSAGMFHAWIEVGDAAVDFTTASLADKAKQLDLADGGRTQVDWSPRVLWANRQEMVPFPRVVNAYEAGAFCYRRHERLECAIMKRHVNGKLDRDIQHAAQAAQVALNALRAGKDVRVLGVDARDASLQQLDDARAKAAMRPL